MRAPRLRGGLRWSAVAAGIAALLALPPLVGALPVRTAHAGTDPRDLLARTMRGIGTPHEGLAEVRGSLGLPDLPGLETATQLLGDTTRVRVWWAAPQQWRIAVLRPAGERDTYRDSDTTLFYDYETDRAGISTGDRPVRLPRPDDLVPPQIAERLLGHLGPADRLSALPARRVGGRNAYGLRVMPGDPRGTIGSLDLWADDATGLPVRVEVRARGSAHAAFLSEFLEVSPTRPTAADLRRRLPPTTATEQVEDPDIIAAYDRRAPFVLPSRLGGLDRAQDVLAVHGAEVYGAGLVRVAVVPLPSRGLRDVLARATGSAGSVPLVLVDGEGLLVDTPLLHAALVRNDDHRHAYLLVGTVSDEVLRRIVAELFANPPPERLGG